MGGRIISSVCSNCGGSGSVKCWICGGSGGQLVESDGEKVWVDCSSCWGKGVNSCYDCGGTGRR